jgi:ketosteroid isomerase-like protein
VKFESNKQLVQFFFDHLWADPEAARQVCTEDVTWVTTRSMPIPGAGQTIEHVGWEAVWRVCQSGLKVTTGYLPETMQYPHRRFLEAEDSHVVFQFTMTCKTKLGRDYINDYLFLVKCRDGKLAHMQEYWDSKQAYDLLLA